MAEKKIHLFGFVINIFPITEAKYMLWELKRTVSLRRFFWAAKTYVLTDKQNFTVKHL